MLSFYYNHLHPYPPAFFLILKKFHAQIYAFLFPNAHRPKLFFQRQIPEKGQLNLRNQGEKIRWTLASALVVTVEIFLSQLREK